MYIHVLTKKSCLFENRNKNKVRDINRDNCQRYLDLVDLLAAGKPPPVELVENCKQIIIII